MLIFALQSRWKILLGVLCFFGAVPQFVSEATGQIAQRTKGKISKNVYSSPDGDYRVAIPNAKVPGASARDEGSNEGWQVIFTDDFGGFYRLLSLKNPKGELSAEGVLRMENYAKVFDKEVVQTSRGREIRFVDIEKNGAEMTVKSSRTLPDGSIQWESITPDLVTANAVFEAHGRLYHLIAGVTMLDLDLPDSVLESRGVSVAQGKKLDQPAAVQKAKEQLAKLLDGFRFGGS